MSELAILVPVLGRPHRVAPLLDSIERATPDATVLFLADPEDHPEHAALEEAGASWILSGGNYAEKIRAGVAETTEPLIFTGADDLDFRPGWFEEARAQIEGAVEVVGVNDLRPRPAPMATHFLMTRSYAEAPTIDGGAGPFHTGYSHNYCDRELVATARSRGVYSYAEAAVVEHLHHLDGKAPHDETYARGQSTFRRDSRLFHRRSRLWRRVR